MKNQIATTIEQSDRITACGVSPDLADMTTHLRGDCYVNEWNRQVAPITLNMPYRDARYLYLVENIVPAWSLSSLLSDILPCNIIKEGIEYSLFLKHERESVWELSYYNLELDSTLVWVEAPAPIEAAVLMVERLYADGLNKIN